jgi:hypothetical protein
MCSCIYMKRNDQMNAVVIIYDHVDDFVFTGNNRELHFGCFDGI